MSPRNDIDAFILANLEEKKFAPPPAADRTTLIRRATLDLTGLVPTPEEVQAFVSDASPDACEKVVEQLPAGAQYGEEWAPRWLDAARYADRDGYEEERANPSCFETQLRRVPRTKTLKNKGC